MLKNGQTVKGKIQYIDDFGNGVINYKNDRILVRNVFKNEEVCVKITKRIQKGYLAQIEEILKKDKNRIQPQCSIYERCGSCHLMHMNTVEQEQYKKKLIVSLCEKAKIKTTVHDVICMKSPYHYRNKMIIGFGKDKKRNIYAGFYEEFSHRIIPYKKCLLHPQICDEIVETITKLLKQLHIEIYDEDQRKGLMRHVLLRYGETTGQIMVVLVINHHVFPARKNFVQALIKAHPQITTIVQNINTRKTCIVLGDDERVLYGPGYIEDELCGNLFRISAKSFYQINHTQCEALYRNAIDLLKLKGKERVIDSYCGIGTIGMYVSKFVKEVIGVEVNRDAVNDAVMNAKHNNIKNIRFLCEDATAYMLKMAGNRQHVDVVIMDPPRSGSTLNFIQSVSKLKIKQVLYISCNPETQIRDIKQFQHLGYEIKGGIYPIDMFPFTNHIESIVLLVRNK